MPSKFYRVHNSNGMGLGLGGEGLRNPFSLSLCIITKDVQDLDFWGKGMGKSHKRIELTTIKIPFEYYSLQLIRVFL